MALRLEVSTMAGSTVNIYADPEGSVLDVLLEAENGLQHMIHHLVTTDACVLRGDQAILASNLQDGDMLQAVLMSDDDKIRTIAKQHGELLSAARSGEYVIIRLLTKKPLPMPNYDKIATHLYHLPSLRTAAEPLYAALLSVEYMVMFGLELIFVGDQEIELRHVGGRGDPDLEFDDGLIYDTVWRTALGDLRSPSNQSILQEIEQQALRRKFG
ncbi:unnamed protein product [Symbiodinium sp. CCMP2592]|nr:unnamed protein product [Symbiodinium sp. CCMP2592]